MLVSLFLLHSPKWFLFTLGKYVSRAGIWLFLIFNYTSLPTEMNWRRREKNYDVSYESTIFLRIFFLFFFYQIRKEICLAKKKEKAADLLKNFTRTAVQYTSTYNYILHVQNDLKFSVEGNIDLYFPKKKKTHWLIIWCICLLRLLQK